MASIDEGLPPHTRKRMILEQINHVFPLPAHDSTTKLCWGSHAFFIEKFIGSFLIFFS